MGAGRKTKTYNMMEKLPPCYTTNCSITARNLKRNDLGGLIFGCTNYTIQECFSKQLFGLPASHFLYVKNVSTGLVLFLFNYSDRKLHGIFEAASPGQLNINPHGWTTDGDERTPYAAQVRVHIRQRCLPPPEEMFAPIIPGNYYKPKLFNFELDPFQTRKLINLFMASPYPERAHHLQTITISEDVISSTSDARGKADDGGNAPRGERRDIEVKVKCGFPNVSTVRNSCVIDTNKAWSSLFKTSSDSDTTGKGDILVPEAMSQTLTQSDQSMGETVSPAISPSVGDGQHQQHEFWEDPWCSDNFEEPVHCSATSPSASDEHQHGSFEGSWASGNFEQPVDSSWCIPTSILTEIGQPPMHNNRKDTHSNAVPNATSLSSYHDIDTAPLLPRTEINSADTDMIVTEKDHGSNSPDLRMALSQLAREIDFLKVSQLEQNQQIRSLEQELIESKLEIRRLRNQSVLTPATSSGPLEEVKFELPHTFPAQVDKSVYLVGGFNGSSWVSNMDSYSVSRDLMRSLSPMTFLRSYCSVTTLNGQLYVMGGAYENVWYDTVEFYSPVTDKWGQLPSLTKKKGSMSSASLYGNLYAFGGGDGVNIFSEVEMFDFNIGRWLCIQTMNQKRFSAAAIENDGALYVVGGYDGINYLSSSARLDPREKKWTKIGTMHSTRGCHSVVALNGNLVALGGYDGSKMVRTVEVLDPRFGSWSVAQPMNMSRGYSGTIVMDSRIYTFGGVNQGGEITDTIECYSEDRGWEVTNLKTMGKRCFFSALVL